jgi:hypothetical protein
MYVSYKICSEVIQFRSFYNAKTALRQDIIPQHYQAIRMSDARNRIPVRQYCNTVLAQSLLFTKDQPCSNRSYVRRTYRPADILVKEFFVYTLLYLKDTTHLYD